MKLFSQPHCLVVALFLSAFLVRGETVAKEGDAQPSILTEAHELLVQGKSPEVLAQIDAALAPLESTRDAPGSWWADLTFLKANLLMMLGRAPEAEALAETMHRVGTDPETQRLAKVLLAAATMRGGNPQAAVEALDAVAKESTKAELQAAATIYKGQSLLELKDWENALLCFLQMLVLYPEQKGWTPGSILGIGRAHFGLDDFPKARAAFKDLTRNYTGTPEAAAAKIQLDLVLKREKALNAPKATPVPR